MGLLHDPWLLAYTATASQLVYPALAEVLQME